MNRKIGYARVSKYEQDLQMQIDALLNLGCEKNNIFTDHISGSKIKRPGLDQCIKTLQKGDILIVWRLDRLGRSMSHLVSLIEDLKTRVRGKKGGRKKIIGSDPKVLTAKKMHKNHNMSINNICKMLSISRATFYRYVSISND
ncbi:recombinase family protein [Candidatus Tisiphia endosymbiont of Mystacides longicornis]|uniref:recombinase family protein n=1 Tax=Candidatus Tisiphia endosymbiont of Mystacides longicornis TaxID=3139330 RepID=UPI003CCB3A06